MIEDYLIIIQARMGSVRFPGKSLYPIHGKPCLEHLLDSLFQIADRSKLYIATSDSEEDKKIKKYCEINHLNVFCGSEHNVASRFAGILKDAKPEYFLRLSGDSPLFDYRIINYALSFFHSRADIISTVVMRQFPSGMNVEIINKLVFLKEYPHFSKKDHFEHVTKYFYENTEKFNIVKVVNDIENSEKYKFSIDTIDDYNTINSFFNHISKPHYHYTLIEKCDIYKMLFH